jgi:hypothetical protein
MKVKRRIQAMLTEVKKKETTKSRKPEELKKKQKEWRNPSPLQGMGQIKALRRERSRQEMNQKERVKPWTPQRNQAEVGNPKKRKGIKKPIRTLSKERNQPSSN